MRVFGHQVYVPIALLVALEFTVAVLALLICVTSLAGSHGTEFSLSQLSVRMALFGGATTAGMTAVGLYHAKQRLRLGGVVVRVFVALVFATILVALLDLVFPVGVDGHIWLLSIVATSGLVSAIRVISWRWFDHDVFRRRVLVYGAGQRAANLLKLRRQSDRRGFSIVAFVPADGDRRRVVDERVVGLEGSILDFARRHDISEIVVAMDDRRAGFPIADLLRCKFAGIAVTDLLAFLERETGRVSVELVNPSWLIFSEGFSSSARTEFSSRALDLTAAVVLLAIAMPIMLVAVIAIFIEDGMPVLYRQERVGFRGRVFTVYKFRSMVKNAEADGRAQWAGAHDQRVTRTGRLFRKLRVDELPQLFNVLRGDMSLVGPRPERPEFVERLSQTIPYYHERHVVKPGLTGWAQLCYPYGSSDRDALEKLQFDLYYIKHKSLVFDLMVLLQTAEVVLWGKGAR